MNPTWIFYAVIFLMTELNKKKGRVLGDVVERSQGCKEILENFAVASAGFVFCTLQNARPVHICCSCVEEYYKVLDAHDNITQKSQNSSCEEKLINQDRLEVIENGFSYIKELWSRGQCQNCFENKTTLSRTTKEFINLYSDTNDCLENEYNMENKTYNPDVCFTCSKVYYNMSRFYAKLKETSGNGNICMDIVDTVNVTQHLWSNVLHCGETVMRLEIPLIATSCAFFIIPIFFYTCAWMFTKDISSAVLNQNRVSQRFRERWRSRAGSRISGTVQPAENKRQELEKFSRQAPVQNDLDNDKAKRQTWKAKVNIMTQ